MKRVITVIAAFVLVALITVSAQAEGKGGQLFTQKCAACHALNGKGGTLGPDLTGIAIRMNGKDLQDKLENPKKNNPKSFMPSFKSLPKAEMDALLEYLKTLK